MDRPSSHVKQHLRAWSITLLVAGIAILYFFNAQAIGDGIRRGMDVCAGTLIPSLFPFMVLCTFLVHSRFIDYISAPFSRLTTRLLRLPSFTGAVFILSLVGGFPVGAKMISELYKENRITSHTASRMLCFCVNAGPAFLITAVGSRMFGSTAAGLLLFCSQTAASIVIALLSRTWMQEPPQHHTFQSSHKPLVPAFIASVNNAAQAMISVCAFVIVFSSIVSFVLSLEITQLLENFLPSLPSGMIKTILYGTFEVTLGCSESTAVSGVVSIYLACAICSFGGISVMGQAVSFFTGLSIKTLPYLITRPIHMLFSCTTLFLLIRLFPNMLTVFLPLNKGVIVRTFSVGPSASAVLLLLCAALVSSNKDHAFD